MPSKNLLSTARLAVPLLLAGLLLVTLLPTAGLSAQAHIVINEAYYAGGIGARGLQGGGDWVEFKNIGNEPQNISTWRICTSFDYGNIGDQTIFAHDGSNDYLLNPGEVLAVEFADGFLDDEADLGLYLASGPFSSAAAMEDFLKYGGDGALGRSTVAKDAGVWIEVSAGVYDFTPLTEPGESVQYCGSGARLSTSGEFINDFPTPGLDNDCETSNALFSLGFESTNVCLWSGSTPDQGCDLGV